MKCRACGGNCRSFLDLGISPLANDYREKNANQPQYPLEVWACSDCDMGQLTETVNPSQIFSDYLYFSSQSPSWVADRKAFADRIVNELDLVSSSLVIDIGSNDGYFLRHLRDTCMVLGYEPAGNVAHVAEDHGIKTRIEFWGANSAQGLNATLINATNVFAHTPDMNGFMAGIAGALAADGIATLEFPLFSNLIRYNQIDTIYHEHYSYITVQAVSRLADRYDLRPWRIEELPTHGGSVRMFLSKIDSRYRVEESVGRICRSQVSPAEQPMQGHAWAIKNALREYLTDAPGIIVGYGAPAKATVLCNYVGLDRDDLYFIVDDSPYKQGKLVPGTNIPIVPFEHLVATEPPAAILLFPWNLREPITVKLRAHYDNAEYRPVLVTAIPELRITNL
jgi:hypothetical protein